MQGETAFTDADVVRVAKGLTKAQQYALTWKGTSVGVVASNAQLADHLVSKGVAVRTTGYNGGRMLDWTKLGLAVRALIQEKENV